MKPIDAEDAKQLVAEIKSQVPFFRGIDDKAILALVSQSLVETTQTLADIERRIEEAGVVPGDIAGVLLHYGAVAAVVEDLPATSHQRQMVTAGRTIGRFIAERFGKKIREQLEAKTTQGKDN